MAWFLLGLLVGIIIFSGCWFRRESVFWRQLQVLGPEPGRRPFSRSSRLTRAIAAHQEINQSLLAELQTLRYLFEHAPIGFLQVDEENQLLFCNVKACQLLNLETCKSEKPRLLLELVRSYELDALVEQTRHAQSPCQSEWLLHPVDADFAKLSRQQSQPLRGYGLPMAQGCVAIFLESREETVMLARQRDRWISDVAHELKTPLTSIRLVAETLQTRLENPAREWVERLLKETIRLSNLVQDLLDLNQLQAQPNPRLTLKTLDLVSMIQMAWTILEPLAREKHLQLDYHGAERMLVQADETRLHRVLLNLLDNSIKYSPTHQSIRVEVGLTSDPRDAAAQCVHIQVIDAGGGFPEESIPFLFERFYRVDPSRTRPAAGFTGSDENTPAGKTVSSSDRQRRRLESPLTQLSGGNGLGLAIVQQIVDAHQGMVTASNHPDTGGAWLQVFLPWHPLN
ncbi:MAG: PAS domain-containing sensor histidine kinase [Leptolyngbyaceae cyanobacterium bins.349]|nr:PAS domain-containing sensor histidine kinase [Leptolyngbyaceae cyanobacterium bins.349]